MQTILKVNVIKKCHLPISLKTKFTLFKDMKDLRGLRIFYICSLLNVGFMEAILFIFDTFFYADLC